MHSQALLVPRVFGSVCLVNWVFFNGSLPLVISKASRKGEATRC